MPLVEMLMQYIFTHLCEIVAYIYVRLTSTKSVWVWEEPLPGVSSIARPSKYTNRLYLLPSLVSELVLSSGSSSYVSRRSKLNAETA
jgi:hypothetical protein